MSTSRSTALRSRPGRRCRASGHELKAVSSGGGGRNGAADFRGQPRRNDSHASTTDGDARLFRKGHGQETRLAYLGHLLTENRYGLVVRVATTELSGGRNGRRGSP